MKYWNQKTFCLITGASQGIGKCIAIEFAKVVGEGSVFLLIARSGDKLQHTKTEILQHPKNTVTVILQVLDLSIPDSANFQHIIKRALDQSGSKPSDFQHSMIVQNAASLGIKTGLTIIEVDDVNLLRDYYNFNLFTFILLNSEFFKIFDERDIQKQLRSAVHISSSGAVEPFPSWGLYCAAKGARDMLMKSMALESGIHAISWAPGSVDTAIYEEAVQFTSDLVLAKAFDDDRKAGKVLSCEQTVLKLMKVIASQEYIKGQHCEYKDFA